jgi:hypothetical protein
MLQHIPVHRATSEGRWLYATDYAPTAAKLHADEALVLVRDDLALVCPDADTWAVFAQAGALFEAYGVPTAALAHPAPARR